MAHPAVLIASFAGIGFIRPAPGTWGSAAAVLVWWLWLAELGWPVQLGLAAMVFVLGWWCSAVIARRYQVDDASAIVIDEVAGMWLALVFAPKALVWAVGALLLFRLLDVWKPGPIGWLDVHVKGGLGVMLDDVLAGLIVSALVAVMVFTIYPGVAHG